VVDGAGGGVSWGGSVTKKGNEGRAYLSIMLPCPTHHCPFVVMVMVVVVVVVVVVVSPLPLPSSLLLW
jgi:hypothetical protein